MKFKEFTQPEAIYYAVDFRAPCGHCGDGYYWTVQMYGQPLPKATLIGYCHDKTGYQMVFECPFCFKKFRYHNCTSERWNKAKFFESMELVKKLEK